MKDKRDEEIKRINEQQKIEQNLASVCQVGPRLWRGLYVNLLEEGFDELQSLDLLKTFISSAHANK